MGAVEIQTYLAANGISTSVGECIPESVDGKEDGYLSGFCKYLDDHPEKLHVNAAIAVLTPLSHRHTARNDGTPSLHSPS